METQLDILSEAKGKLNGFAKEKIEKSMRKSLDFENFNQNKDFEYQLKNRFAHIVSVDVERSFFLYKCILSDSRQRFTQKYQNDVNYQI